MKMKRYDPEVFWAEGHGHAVRMGEAKDGIERYVGRF